MRDPVRIAFLLVKHPPERKSPIIPEVMHLLRERGTTVDVLHPDESVTGLASVRVEHDLYVLKSGTDRALSLSGALHAQGASILNPYPVAAALRDKVVATRVLQAAGVPVPETWVASEPRQLSPLLEGGALVVKPYRGSQGRGVQVVRSAAELDSVPAYDALVFAQRHHAPDGPDRKLYCIGGRVFGVKRIWPPRSYEDKLGEPFAVSSELEEIALRCGRAFGVTLFGVDVVMSGGRPYVVDMQAFPGFKGVPDAALQLANEILAVARRSGGTPQRGPRQLDRELGRATRLALEAGAVLRRRRAEKIEVSEKANGEVVTAADREVDALVSADLAAEFPADAVYSEESDDSPARLPARRVWIVDPIDATSDYASGGDEHCVSIGLAIDGAPVLGVVYNPARDELFAGRVGVGVTRNGSAVSTTEVATLAEARLEFSRKELRRGLDAHAVALRARPVASMAYKLARVAAGLSDGTFSLKRRKEWGTCAGVALVLAAGGRATVLDGSVPTFNRPPGTPPLGLVAAGARLHQPLLDAVRAIAPPER
jgi:fructose-1,6-bisphosphatase/inositol monophosphatase family enzyme/glutathione synthase/RimK-type ligase-like ATP-grasp enzyme